ncbi:MAG: phosphoribosylanthranilate isomerase [Ignavibacteriae bacterium]|nr:phosphoribosylanthranilate isomerase [Ignavibacteriota bacterium]
MKVKICGITNIEDAKLACELGADAIGFIFYNKSKRYVTPDETKHIIEQIPPFVLKVGVFVNESAEEINKISKEIKLNLIQFHGDESPEMVDFIDLPAIKAFRVKVDFDYSILTEYKNCSFLLDAYDEKEYGGTGQKFNWEKIPLEIKSKIILAGGISEENIEKIFNKIKPYAIDVSSSLEIEPGKKDYNKLNKFFRKINELRINKC